MSETKQGAPVSEPAPGSAPAPAPSSPPDPHGLPTIPGLVIEKALGLGALGKAYRATPQGGGGPAIVKILDEKITGDATLKAKVLADIDAYARLSHPQILRVVAKGETGEGQPFYAVELIVESTTLLDLVRRGRPLDGPELAWLGRGLAAGLAALHGGGLAHGELTPVNVSLAVGGVLKVADLGWAPRIRDTHGGSALAKSSSQRFSQQMIAQAIERGDRDDARRIAAQSQLRSDIAALGATLTFATTGQPAKAGGPRLAERATWLPQNLAELCDALRSEPDKRPTAAQALAKFEALAKELGVGALPPRTLDEALVAVLGPGTGASHDTEPGINRSSTAGLAPALGTFGRYVLEEEIARGGMGVVFRAKHSQVDRTFALKVLLAGEIISDQSRARFLREAEAAGRLDHPGIVRVHDYGEVEGRLYMAMDLAPGLPLNELYRKPGFGLREQILPILEKTASAVHYAHARGIIHRDLKPANVVVDEQGQPRILDFGVAKRVDLPHEAGKGSAGLTTAGELVGTPAYMPPEQAEGRTNDVDTRSDVYSLGVILYECATRGRLPFEGTNVTDVLTKVLLDDPKPPSRHVSGIPWEVDAIVLKALEKDPRKRYQSAAELQQDIRRILDGEPISARPAGNVYRIQKWVTRNRVPVAVGGIALVVVFLLLLGQLLDAKGRAVARAVEVERRVTDGRRLLGAGKPREARDEFVAAANLDPRSVQAQLGVQAAEHVLEQAQRAKEEDEQKGRAKARATIRVKEGQRLLATLDFDGARVAFRQALLDDRDNQDAEKGADEAARRGVEKAELERLRRERERTGERVAALVAEGHASLAAGRTEEAKRAFLQALGFDGQSEKAHAGLAEAQRVSFEEKAKAAQGEQRARDKAEAERLVEAGKTAFLERNYDEARKRFLQALGFDGTSEPATEGLVNVDRRLASLAKEQDLKRRREEAQKQLKDGRAALERGRTLSKENAEQRAIRAAYFEALQAFDKAATIAPEDIATRQEKAGAARELARIAKAEGSYGLAEYLELMAGDFPPAPDEASAPAEAGDPNLVVRESEAEGVRRAFREQVEFERCESWFSWVKDGLIKPKGARFKLIVEVRSRVEGTTPPTVYAVGLTLKIQDKDKNVTTAPEQIDFEGGPYQRIVVAGPGGRVVRPFFSAHRFDARTKDSPVAKKVEEVTQALLARLAEKKP